MSDIHVQPPDEAPETVTFGPGGGRGPGGWLRDHPWLRALRERRLPYGVVATVSAVIAGVAVATYMDRPVEVVEAGPSQSWVNLQPESWLNVQVDEVHEPPPGEEQERMLARHPPEATVALPLELYREHLFGLPSGTYHVQASCSAETVDAPGVADPLWFAIDITDPATYQPLPESSVDRDEDLHCDGGLRTISANLTVTGHQAIAVYYSSALDEVSAEASGGVVVVASFTPVS